jgi:hypothetical protein
MVESLKGETSHDFLPYRNFTEACEMDKGTETNEKMPGKKNNCSTPDSQRIGECGYTTTR